MSGEKPLVDKTCLLYKYPGKGGWTYTTIEEISPDHKSRFGWVQVKGSIDGFPLKQYKLMPMGNGKLFLPVRAEIRKKIGKEAGDTVRVVLYKDNSAAEIPEELLLCFENEPPHLLNRFKRFTDSEQKAYIDWIYSAGKTETRARRISVMMQKLERGLRQHESLNK